MRVSASARVSVGRGGVVVRMSEGVRRRVRMRVRMRARMRMRVRVIVIVRVWSQKHCTF